MNETFNPYREWLELDPLVEAPDYYDLLALPRFEDDAARLLAAADRALVRVRSHRPGAHAALWARLLDELTAAKRCLCDPQQKAAYDQSLQRGTNCGGERPRSTADPTPEIAAVNLSPDLYPPGMAPKVERAASIERPADRAVKKPSPANHATAAVSVPVHNLTPPGSSAPSSSAPNAIRPKHVGGHSTPPGQPSAAGDMRTTRGDADSPESDVVHAPAPPGPVNAHVAPPRKEPVSLLPMAAIVTSIVVVVTVIVLVIALHDDKAGSPLVPAPPAPVPGSSRETPRPAPFQPPITHLMPRPNAGGRSSLAAPSTPAPAASQRLNALPSTDEVASNEAAASPAALMVSDRGVSEESVATTPDELKQLGQMLSLARADVARHEFSEARRTLEQAGKLAKSDDHLALVERLSMLADLADQFWSGVATATRQLQATQEIQVGSGDLIVVVVETGPDWLTIHNQGQSTRYLVAEMPAGLALAIARQNMNEDDPQTQLMFGAGLATVKDLQPVHLEEARRYWERAAAAGADAAPLQTVLTDTYELSE